LSVEIKVSDVDETLVAVQGRRIYRRFTVVSQSEEKVLHGDRLKRLLLALFEYAHLSGALTIAVKIFGRMGMNPDDKVVRTGDFGQAVLE
jgi:hypothetical protein